MFVVKLKENGHNNNNSQRLDIFLTSFSPGTDTHYLTVTVKIIVLELCCTWPVCSVSSLLMRYIRKNLEKTRPMRENKNVRSKTHRHAVTGIKLYLEMVYSHRLNSVFVLYTCKYHQSYTQSQFWHHLYYCLILSTNAIVVYINLHTRQARCLCF